MTNLGSKAHEKMRALQLNWFVKFKPMRSVATWVMVKNRQAMYSCWGGKKRVGCLQKRDVMGKKGDHSRRQSIAIDAGTEVDSTQSRDCK